MKLKKILSEHAPGYANRQFGSPLPTLDSVQKAFKAKQSVQEESAPITEEYVEGMHDIDDGLALIKKAWLAWKTGPMTEKEDISPAQSELVKYVNGWIKKNIK